MPNYPLYLSVKAIYDHNDEGDSFLKEVPPNKLLILVDLESLRDIPPEYFDHGAPAGTFRLYTSDQPQLKGYFKNGEKEFLRRHNTQEYEKLANRFNELVKEIGNHNQDSPIRIAISGQLKSIKSDIVHFSNWFLEQNLKLPNIKILDWNSDVVAQPEKQTQIDQQDRQKWIGTKSEFANKINAEYEKNKSNYKSLQDASNKIFNKYIFNDPNWSKEKCYDLVRKR